MKNEERAEAEVVRLTLRGVLAMLLVLLVAGFLGGVAGGYWFQPALPPLTDNPEQLVATVQEVTISPSKAAAQVIQEKGRSILLIGSAGEQGQPEPLAIGAVVTNDGVIAVPGNGLPTEEALVAWDGERPAIELTKIGEDTLYGLSYYRLREGVLTPLNLADSNPAVGAQLLLAGRDIESAGMKADTVTASGYAMADDTAAAGWQLMLQVGDLDRSDFLIGSPFLSDDGSLVALQVSDSNMALPVEVLRESLRRLTEQQHEVHALEDWGLGLTYGFDYTDEGVVEFTVEVASVRRTSPAGVADLRAGDRLVAVDDTEVSSEILVPTMFDVEGDSLTVSRDRGGRVSDVVLTKESGNES